MRGNERVDRLSGGQEEALKLLARKAARWVADHADNLSDDPPMPEQLRGRNADNWQSLIAIADQAGGPWREWRRLRCQAGTTRRPSAFFCCMISPNYSTSAK